MLANFFLSRSHTPTWDCQHKFAISSTSFEDAFNLTRPISHFLYFPFPISQFPISPCFFLQSDGPFRRMSTPSSHLNQGGVYSRGHTRHTHSPLTGIMGVSMPISNHPASNHQYDGRGISPVSDEEYEGFTSMLFLCNLETFGAVLLHVYYALYSVKQKCVNCAVRPVRYVMN